MSGCGTRGACVSAGGHPQRVTDAPSHELRLIPAFRARDLVSRLDPSTCDAMKHPWNSAWVGVGYESSPYSDSGAAATQGCGLCAIQRCWRRASSRYTTKLVPKVTNHA